jgi:hypothetical protein
MGSVSSGVGLKLVSDNVMGGLGLVLGLKKHPGYEVWGKRVRSENIHMVPPSLVFL